MKTRNLALATLAGAVLCSTALTAAEPVKVGFVYVSPVGDAGWTYQHDLGRKQMEAALKGQVTTKFIENVPEGADAERIIRQLAQDGNQIIFTTSFGYMNPTEKVSKPFPKVTFFHATGYKSGANMGIYNARFYEGRYLNGVIAGKMSKTNVAGYVAAFPIPEVVMGINAFARGMKSVNPKAEVRVIWVNSWFDPGKEREAAMTLIAQGADMITHHRPPRRSTRKRAPGPSPTTPTWPNTAPPPSCPAPPTSGASSTSGPSRKCSTRSGRAPMSGAA